MDLKHKPPKTQPSFEATIPDEFSKITTLRDYKILATLSTPQLTTSSLTFNPVISSLTCNSLNPQTAIFQVQPTSDPKAANSLVMRVVNLENQPEEFIARLGYENNLLSKIYHQNIIHSKPGSESIKDYHILLLDMPSSGDTLESYRQSLPQHRLCQDEA
jgi:serine/threonine protein kinase